MSTATENTVTINKQRLDELMVYRSFFVEMDKLIRDAIKTVESRLTQDGEGVRLAVSLLDPMAEVLGQHRTATIQNGKAVPPSHEVLDAMRDFGGSFIKSLRIAYLNADASNRDTILNAFSNYFSQYEALAQSRSVTEHSR